MTDFELIYMLRQNSNEAFEYSARKFENLAWKVSHDSMYIQRPEGVQVVDLYQEAMLGLVEALYTFRVDKNTGFAHYVKICVVSHVNTRLRKCRSASFLLIDTAISLDMPVTEDMSVSLMDVVSDYSKQNDPVYQAMIEEGRERLERIISNISIQEQAIYELWKAGYSYKEISLRLNASVKDIDNKLQKIKRLVNQKAFIL